MVATPLLESHVDVFGFKNQYNSLEVCFVG